MLKNKVAIVTGSGQGLGLKYAHALASEGCKVVINDIGSSVTGESSNTSDNERLADKIVREFNQKYGANTAVASYSPVSQSRAHEILETTLNAFGRVDILINNAGIVRDKVFEKTDVKDWNLLLDVHLSGVYRLSQLVYGQFRRQPEPFGKILFIASVAIFGSFGQTAYASLKSALLGLCHSLAKEIEMRKQPYHVNTIIPLADSRILRTSNLPGEVLDQLQIEPILPAILYLVSPECKENGGVFETAGGVLYRISLRRSPAIVFQNVQQLTQEFKRLEGKQYTSSDEAVIDLVNDIGNLKKATKTSSSSTTMANEELSKLFEQIQKNLSALPQDEKVPGKTFLFSLTEGKFLLDFTSRTLRKLEEGDTTKPEVTIIMNDEDFLKMMQGKANAQSMFFAKKLKTTGNLGTAMKLIGFREKLVNSAASTPLQSKL